MVVAETYSWFLHKYGEDAARAFRAFFGSLPNLVLTGADSSHQKAVWKKLDHLRGCQLTYVDASSLIWLAERKIHAVWGTDHHLAIEGAVVTPGPPPR